MDPGAHTIIFMAFKQGIYINTSTSMPLGIYLSVPTNTIKSGDIVAVCLAKKFATLGLAKNYLSSGARCHSAEPLIKQVLAVPGDKVEVYKDKIRINGKPYFYQTFTQDSQQRKLATFPNGIYQSAGYWLIGTHDEKSWDSRYFGFVKRDAIMTELKKLITF